MQLIECALLLRATGTTLRLGAHAIVPTGRPHLDHA